MFKPQFAPLVRSGVKRQTIRPTPKGRLPQVGDKESWRQWSGLPYRSKTIELAQVELVGVEWVYMTKNEICVKGKRLASRAVSKIATLDGFKTAKEFKEWFSHSHGLPFSGILITAR